MPERPLTIAGYAAGASLAAITLVYVFGPTFFLDDEAANTSKSTRKKGVVGLMNAANDCFINSTLQVLAGLPELRLYLIREMHRRRLDGPELYEDLSAAIEEQTKNKDKKAVPDWKLLGLQQGLVTAGLKDILDSLNERPIYRKTISAASFIRVVEVAYKTRVSRSQQDAQEFLQIVAERLDDEHHAGRRVRQHAQRKGYQRSRADSLEVPDGSKPPSRDPVEVKAAAPTSQRDRPVYTNGNHVMPGNSTGNATSEEDDESPDEAFPLEGKLESQVECSHCHFKPRPHTSSFVTLTLNVPQGSKSTTLNACFDGMFKQEQIDDFTCDKCRLDHALQVKTQQLSQSKLSEDERRSLEQDKDKIEEALREDPEKPPKDVKLPDLASAPKRRISRHMRISSFPRILSLHLSRSMWDPGSSSSKNTSKVSFPETLPLGGLLDRKTFRLLGVVTHKGGHNSGHYETFRRQYLTAPYSTPTSMGTEGIFSMRTTPNPSPRVSAASSPTLNGRTSKDTVATDSQSSSPATQTLSTPSLDSPSSSSTSFRSSMHSPTLDRRKPPAPTSVPLDAIPTPGLPPPPEERQSDSSLKRVSSLSGAVNRVAGAASARRKKGPDIWWRISDDKIKESRTSDVLKMEREVYLLFYEIVDDAQA